MFKVKRLKEFDVTITETLKLTVSVEASSKEEAEQMVSDQWRAGDHVLDITVYASRINSFGTFHLNDESTIWFGPKAWRSTGMRWTRTYRLARSGLLSEPMLLID